MIHSITTGIQKNIGDLLENLDKAMDKYNGGAAPSSLTIPIWKGGFRDKIANFSRLHCFAIPKLNIEIWPESLGVLLEF